MPTIQDHLKLLGRHAKCRVTGFAGVISSVSFDLYGCIQAVLSPPVNDKGERVQGEWFDVNRLEVSGKPVMNQPEFVQRDRAARTDKGPADKPASPRY